MGARVVVLVVSTDFELVRVLSAMLSGDGFSVVACAAPDQARELPRPFQAAGLVMDHPADGNAVSLVAELRAAGVLLAPAPVVFVCELVEDWSAVAALGGRLVTKPASLLDVADLIRLAAPPRPVNAPVVRARPAAPSARRGEAMASARALTRWWASGATGVFIVEGSAEGLALLAQGGPVGQDAVAAIEHALSGGEVTLDRCEIDEPGDRALMARMLWRAARDAVAGESVISLIPVPNGLTKGANGLPLSPEMRRCLERLGGVSVERLAKREQASAVEVSAEFAALRWLGLLGLRDPLAPAIDVEVDTPSRTPGLLMEVVEDTSSPVSRDVPGLLLDRLVRDGIAAVARGDWARADELLFRAHIRAPENAAVSAHLGWARFHNPALRSAQREADGAVLVELALQIDPNCALAWRYSGEMASLRGDMAEAARCFGAALKLLS